jgi:hypothetical protein
VRHSLRAQLRPNAQPLAVPAPSESPSFVWLSATTVVYLQSIAGPVTGCVTASPSAQTDTENFSENSLFTGLRLLGLWRVSGSDNLKS